MPIITPVPLEVICSQCNASMILGHLDIESEGVIIKSWAIIDRIDIICPHCKSLIQEASDDFTRILDGFKD